MGDCNQVQYKWQWSITDSLGRKSTIHDDAIPWVHFRITERLYRETTCLTTSMLERFSPSGRTSCRKISWRYKAARFLFRLFNRCEIWQASQQRCYWDICQVSKPYYHNIQSRGFETARDLAVRRLTAQWTEALKCVRRSLPCSEVQ